jgi:hypothetical protein
MLPRMGVAGLALAGLATLAAGALAAPPKESLLQALEAEAKKDGERLIGDAKGGELDDAKEVTLTFEVDSTKQYKLYSVCDEDCSELSVSARDADGGFIDNSSGQDSDTPVLEVEDFKGSTISVDVFMMNCKADPCAFAVSLAQDPNASVRRIADLSELIGGSSSASNRVETSADSEEDLVSQLKARALDHLVLVGEIGAGKLGTGEAMRYFHDVDSDAIYTAFAICSCADLNMAARDDDDRTLASDLASDARPIVQVTLDSWPEARRKGEQRLVVEVKMADCGRASCGFAVALYKSK